MMTITAQECAGVLRPARVAMMNLSKQAYVLEAREVHGLTWRDIGEFLGVTGSRARQLWVIGCRHQAEFERTAYFRDCCIALLKVRA